MLPPRVVVHIAWPTATDLARGVQAIINEAGRRWRLLAPDMMTVDARDQTAVVLSGNMCMRQGDHQQTIPSVSDQGGDLLRFMQISTPVLLAPCCR